MNSGTSRPRGWLMRIFKDLWLSSDHERRKNMGTVIFDMSMSLDGFIAGPKDDSNPDRELGALDILHDWMFPPKGNFQEIASERFKNDGAVVMGRRMFDPGEEPWGDNPVFHAPVFVLSRSEEHTSELQSRGQLVCRV